MNQNSNGTLAKHTNLLQHPLLLWEWREKTGGFCTIWGTSGKCWDSAIVLMQSWHWDRIWAGPIPDHFTLYKRGWCSNPAKFKDLFGEVMIWKWSILKPGFGCLLQAQISEENPLLHQLKLFTSSHKSQDCCFYRYSPQLSHSPARAQLFWGSQEFRANKEIK